MTLKYIIFYIYLKFDTSETGDYEARFEKMTINEERVVKIVPDRIFSMVIHPSSHKVIHPNYRI